MAGLGPPRLVNRPDEAVACDDCAASAFDC